MRSTARHEAIARARQLLKQRPVYLDTETTGLDDRAEIVDVCIVDWDGRVLLDSLVRPLAPIPPGATRVHGITEDMVAAAPTWAELWPSVASHLSARLLAIYNADFDIRLMEQSHQAHQMPWRPPYADHLCVMKLYAQYYGSWNARRRSFRWVKLEQAARHLNIATSQTHRAKDDALLARAVLQGIAGLGKTTPADVTDSPS